MSNDPMLRKERQMSDEDAREFLMGGRVGRLAVNDGDTPYVVPFIFFFDEKKNEILLHCAKKGRKIRAISSNNRVCFEVDEMKEIISVDAPCEFDLAYRSVLVEGRATLMTDDMDKADALNKIFKKYAPNHGGAISKEMAKGTLTIRISIDSLVGKQGAQATGIIPYPQP